MEATTKRTAAAFAALDALYWAGNASGMGFLTAYFLKCGLGSGILSLVIAIFQALSLAGGVFWGNLCDRRGTNQRIFLPVFPACQGILLLIYYLASRNMTLACLLYFAAGFLISSMGTNLDVWILRSVRYDPASFGVIRGIGSIGYAVSMLATGFLVEAFGYSVIVTASYLHLSGHCDSAERHGGEPGFQPAAGAAGERRRQCERARHRHVRRGHVPGAVHHAVREVRTFFSAYAHGAHDAGSSGRADLHRPCEDADAHHSRDDLLECELWNHDADDAGAGDKICTGGPSEHGTQPDGHDLRRNPLDRCGRTGASRCSARDVHSEKQLPVRRQLRTIPLRRILWWMSTSSRQESFFATFG